MDCLAAGVCVFVRVCERTRGCVFVWCSSVACYSRAYSNTMQSPCHPKQMTGRLHRVADARLQEMQLNQDLK